MTAAKTTGDLGEQFAAAYLEKRGYHILRKNYRYHHAEIDLICEWMNGGFHEIVFVEVKTRTSDRHGRPEDAVGARKRKLLFRAAEGYLLQNRQVRRVRFDVVSIEMVQGLARINHIRDAFS